MTIRILDETTINQIAAGEVVENAASVVKELIENALDAGATEITVETRAGGQAEIRVIDDGIGMSADDLLLSVERHATSKIIQLEELNSISTMGFRGEALPSIASISKMSIESRGQILQVNGGKIGSLRVAPQRAGTSVEVRSLFFNVPVRKKFQKSVGAENAAIHKVLIQMVLCYPTVKFCWVRDGEEQFSVGGFLLERIKALLGEEFATAMLPVEQSEKVDSESYELNLTGYLGRPALHRPNRTAQYLFINQRAVVSPLISKRILEGYGTRLPIQRYPAFVLHLKVPSHWVDVNVHPQKREVRIRKEERLGPFLIQAADRSLQIQAIPRPFVEEEISFSSSPFISDLREGIKSEVSQRSGFADMVCAEAPAAYEIEEQEIFSLKPHIISKIGNYILMEDESGIRIVDGMRARSRILFEHLTTQKSERSIQSLLIPINLEFSGVEKTLLLKNLEKLEEMGLSIRHFGGDTFIVDAIPSLMEMDEVKDMIYAFLEDPQEKMGLILSRSLRRPVHSLEEAAIIVEKLFICDQPHESPDGKPTHYLLTEKELKKRFDEAH